MRSRNAALIGIDTPFLIVHTMIKQPEQILNISVANLYLNYKPYEARPFFRHLR